MNPTYHRPLSLKISPTVGQPACDAPDMFNLWLSYRPEGNSQLFLRIHVPKVLQPALTNGDVAGLHIETLEMNSLAQRSLPGQPDYQVLALQTRAGLRLSEVPVEHKRARRRYGAGAVVTILAGTALFCVNLPWVGAPLLVLGSHLVRTARQVPSRPFRVLSEQC